MDIWPSHTPTQNEKGNVNITLLPYPLLQGGALTSATLREDEQRHFQWVTPQNRASRRKLVCSEEPVLAFPATRSPQLHQQTTSLLQRAEQGAHFLRTYYPDVDVPAQLIREQVGEEAKLEDSLCAFDPLAGDLLTSFHVSDGSKRPCGFMAFPMGENGCDLNFSNIEFSAEGRVITEPSHYPAKKFETPIRQIASSPASSDFNKETMVGVRTFSSTSLSSLSLPTSKQSKRTAFIEVKEIDSIDTSKLGGHVAVDVQIHSSLEYAALVNDQGNAAERGVQVYSVARGPDLCTSIETNLDDGLSRLVTTSELIWIDPRFHNTPVLAWKHEREYDRTLSSHAVDIEGMKLTVLSSRNNSLLSVYDVSSNKTGLLQSDESNATTASLVQLTNRGGIYQTALVLGQDKDTTPFPATVDVSWSSAVHLLATTCSVQPDIGKLGARAMQEVDLRQAYQRLFSPLDATEAAYPAENAGAVYQTLDMMPLFWQEASTAHEHLLTTFDIAFRSGEEPTHASRADFLTQSAMSSRRGFRALTQGRIPRELLIKDAAWDVQTIAERLRRYDLVLDDYRSGSSLRRESEAREQLAVDLVLSTDVYSGQSFAQVETEVTGDDGVETMSRAAEAMTLSETGLPRFISAT
ncbi:hypothetical protein BJV77DRAFT_1065655 [Russula vinacea]|nr:hypothetical protein BJV77DRAFT_1065655 [Russula vinacea]